MIEKTITELQQQARIESSKSFRDSRAAMGAALTILLIGSLLAVTVPGRIQLLVGGLTGLGTAIAAFLGKTFLDIRRRAIDQLNQAHAIHMAQLHSYFAFQLAEKATPDVRGCLVSDIVRSTIGGLEAILTGFLSTAEPGTLPLERSAGTPGPPTAQRSDISPGSDQPSGASHG